MRIQSIDANAKIIRFYDDRRQLRAFNVAPLIKGPWYGELKDEQYFLKAKVSEFDRTIIWPNGQAIPPEDLEKKSRSVQ